MTCGGGVGGSRAWLPSESRARVDARRTPRATLLLQPRGPQRACARATMASSSWSSCRGGSSIAAAVGVRRAACSPTDCVCVASSDDCATLASVAVYRAGVRDRSRGRRLAVGTRRPGYRRWLGGSHSFSRGLRLYQPPGGRPRAKRGGLVSIGSRGFRPAPTFSTTRAATEIGSLVGPRDASAEASSRITPRCKEPFATPALRRVCGAVGPDCADSPRTNGSRTIGTRPVARRRVAAAPPRGRAL